MDPADRYAVAYATRKTKEQVKTFLIWWVSTTLAVLLTQMAWSLLAPRH
jgi:hypothetical protein